MKFVVDMNLSPAWCTVLREAGWEAVHWSAVGDPRARDATVLAWARERTHVLFTHDLDFGALLAASQEATPSVVQVRTQDVTPESLGPLVIEALRRLGSVLEAGAIVTVDAGRVRARVLPLKR